MAPPLILAAASGFYHLIAHVATGPFPGPADYARVLDGLVVTLDRHAAPLVAYSLVPGRCHLLVGPIGPTRLDRLRGWVGRTHAMPLNALAELVPRVRHIERAPRTAGLVARAEDWPWTSLAQRCAGGRTPVLIDGEFLHSAAWRDYVNASLTPAERAVDQLPPVVRSA